MSLKSYCEENNRLRILEEWDTEKNLPITPTAWRTPAVFPCGGGVKKDIPGVPKC